MSANTVATRTLELATQVEQLVKGTPFAPRARAIVERLQGPMRVAIAGRVKAGKSTLLNALVGERLAPTDAGECTRLISWYRHGIGYRVAATLPSGEQRELSFSRDGGALDIKLGDLAEREVGWLDVQWPASTLKDVTLIDTPGLASINDDNSRRTRDFLEHDETNPTDADAVIYLMRHLHRSDVEFLDAFMDRSVTAASPVNAVAVLSRADEVGAGRLDAIDSARRIAERYRNDPAVQRLAATVMPMAGLLAETGLTMLESEAAALRTLAATPDDVLERMLLDAEGFADVHASELTVEVRRHLLDRLGMFGVRVAVREVRAGRATAAQLGPQLVEISGLGELRRVIAQHFLPRARVLQARSALAAVRALARELRSVHAPIADQIDRHAEQLEASAVEFSQIRAAHLVASGVVQVSDGDRRELQTLLLGNGPSKALGLDDGVGPDRVRAEALRAVTRWRNRAADPLAEPRMVEVAEAAARTGESLYAAAVGTWSRASKHDTLDADVIVVGARCAGSATAMLLAAAGHDVLLVDRATFPSDTLSTHAIARSGVVQLHRWGLLPSVLATGAPPIREVAFHVDGATISRTFKEHAGVDLMVAPRRYVLDALLIEEAQRAGARVVTGVRVDSVRRDVAGRVSGVLGSSGDRRVSFRSRFVVGADGLRSRVARLVEASYTEIRPAGSGAAHYAYFAGDWPAMEYYIGDRSFAGIFPTNDGEACIWVCSPSEDAGRIRRSHRSVDDALNAMLHLASPELAKRVLTTATRTSRSRGIIGQPNYIRHPVGPGWALVGDAGYHRDAITGHGISDAFRDAELAATALDRVLRGCASEARALADYHAERDAQLREIFEITCELVMFPPVHRFIELQKQLASAIDNQAGTLAARPMPALPAVA